MEKKRINSKIFTEKTGDYTFVILFFLIFSIFIFFAIRPSLTTAFALRREEEDLRRIDSIYEKKIVEIVSIQSQIEKNRGRLHILDQAIPDGPEINKVLNDLWDLKSFYIKKANIDEVNLVQADNNSFRQLKIAIEGVGSFEDSLKMLRDMFAQRRLKMVDKIVISKDPESTQSSRLKINMVVEAYYL